MRGGGAAFGMGGRFSRGGGVGFSRPGFYSRPAYSYRPTYSYSRSGYSYSRPTHSYTPTYSYSRPSSSSTSPARRTTNSTTYPSRTSVGSTLNGTTSHIAERHDSTWHSDWDRRHAHFFNNRFFVFEDGFWFGLDDGFFPWDYYPYYADDYYPYDYYTDDQSYDDNGAVYNGVPVADATVQAVQTRLAQLGYYHGPVDGVFGPITRDAVAKYQIARQLSVTGSLSPDTLRSLGLPQATAS
jgi:hypothetical protein